MPELAAPVPREEALGAARLREEGALWPWIARFLWAPALDLHPSRRALLTPGWPEEAWRGPASLRHLSRHLLLDAGLTDVPRWHSGATAFRLALLPAEPLAVLARRMALALAGNGWAAREGELDEAETHFLAERAPLYWQDAAPLAADDPLLAGWSALRTALAGQPEAIRRRFAWKTPQECDAAAPGTAAEALLALSQRILRESEEPWSSLFASPVH
ncbi:hypothetical protein [Pseudothauera rhizosphaerae]|uniref:Uncharacterized protein n=1 Tax=Pseudothauera rhizosphaerae TaxID=2565932 RepID=A0A4S4AE27_9RHOO|nr:hypothetical protein [Pseudothauera rhizosphaerae]THF57270.1 hypothetical protein E6O51_18410 [Pseudothauera rhizosphaerae]